MKPEIAEAKALIRESAEVFLATACKDRPFASVSGFIFREEDGWGKAALLLSDLAEHTKRLKQNPQISLLFVEKNDAKPVQQRKRVTLEGQAEAVSAARDFELLKNSYVEKYPYAEIFFQLKDFRFYTISTETLLWFGGFGTAKRLRRKGENWEEEA